VKLTEYRALVTGRRWEDAFAAQMHAAGIDYVREFQFVVGRRFRFDFAFPSRLLAVEIDGAVHRIRNRFTSDREKGNFAVLGGWRVLHFAPAQVKDGSALSLTRIALAGANNLMQTAALDDKEVEA